MKIICATDFTPRARSAARVAIDLARATGGAVELVHIAATRNADVQALTVDVGVFEHEIREGLRTKLAAEARELMGLVPVTSHLGEGSVEGALLSRAKGGRCGSDRHGSARSPGARAISARRHRRTNGPLHRSAGAGEGALSNPPYAYDCPEGKLSDGERVRIETELRALVPTDAERQGITAHVTVIDGGKAAEAITQAAERLVVDAIVLGSHGKSGAVGALSGSVSQATVHRARRPVLVVPSNLAHESNKR